MNLLRLLKIRLLRFSPFIYTHYHLYFFSRPKSLYKISNLLSREDSILSKHILRTVPAKERAISVDLGCGEQPKNPLNAKQVIGIDMQANEKRRIKKCHLGYEPLPFADNSIDCITAYDLIEHIPRFSIVDQQSKLPFIDLMNEIWRVLKKQGVFISHTPVYPFQGCFQDPTHNNFITYKTFRDYFSDKKFSISKSYGIQCNFVILNESLFGEHLVSILQK